MPSMNRAGTSGRPSLLQYTATLLASPSQSIRSGSKTSGWSLSMKRASGVLKKTVGLLSETLAWLYSRSGSAWGSCSIALTGNQQIASFCTKNHSNIAILKHLNGKIIMLNHVVDNF
jgi:hypothetical protein